MHKLLFFSIILILLLFPQSGQSVNIEHEMIQLLRQHIPENWQDSFQLSVNVVEKPSTSLTNIEYNFSNSSNVRIFTDATDKTKYIALYEGKGKLSYDVVAGNVAAEMNYQKCDFRKYRFLQRVLQRIDLLGISERLWQVEFTLFANKTGIDLTYTCRSNPWNIRGTMKITKKMVMGDFTVNWRHRKLPTFVSFPHFVADITGQPTISCHFSTISGRLQFTIPEELTIQRFFYQQLQGAKQWFNSSHAEKTLNPVLLACHQVWLERKTLLTSGNSWNFNLINLQLPTLLILQKQLPIHQKKFKINQDFSLDSFIEDLVFEYLTETTQVKYENYQLPITADCKLKLLLSLVTDLQDEEIAEQQKDTRFLLYYLRFTNQCHHLFIPQMKKKVRQTVRIILREIMARMAPLENGRSIESFAGDQKKLLYLTILYHVITEKAVEYQAIDEILLRESPLLVRSMMSKIQDKSLDWREKKLLFYVRQNGINQNNSAYFCDLLKTKP